MKNNYRDNIFNQYMNLMEEYYSLRYEQLVALVFNDTKHSTDTIHPFFNSNMCPEVDSTWINGIDIVDDTYTHIDKIPKLVIQNEDVTHGLRILCLNIETPRILEWNCKHQQWIETKYCENQLGNTAVILRGMYKDCIFTYSSTGKWCRIGNISNGERKGSPLYENDIGSIYQVKLPSLLLDTKEPYNFNTILMKDV